MNAFEALGLNEQLVRAVTELGFETPTSIQEKAIPVLLSGTTDFMGLAQTGTGKTAAFGLPLLQLIDPSQRHPQALIVCPTRELCLQITNDIEAFKKHSRNIYTEAVYGGASIMMQMRNLKKGVHIVVATPGRLIDLIERKAIDLQKVKYVVLDEADEMLNMGFRDDIDFVLKNTINRESIWLFSATMPPEVRAISKNYMESPKEVTVGKRNSGNVNIDHQYFVVSAQYRYEALKRLIDFNPGMYGIIFTRTKADAQEISERLAKSGYEIEALHGDLSQQQRDKVMGRFRTKNLQLLIATDVAARGIDVDGITHVINYELPDDMEVYTHRSGRTGRVAADEQIPRVPVALQQLEALRHRMHLAQRPLRVERPTRNAEPRVVVRPVSGLVHERHPGRVLHGALPGQTNRPGCHIQRARIVNARTRRQCLRRGNQQNR